MPDKIVGDGFNSCLEEEVGGDEVSPESPAEPSLGDRAEALWHDGVETVKDLGRSVYSKAKDAEAAVDLEGNIEALGPGDSLKVRAGGQVRAGVGGAMAEGLEVKRGSDGRYTVSGSAELGVVAGVKLEVGSKALQSMGVEQTGTARVELSCDSAEEAARATRALRNTQLRQLGVPMPGQSEDLALIASKTSAIEVGLRQGGYADGQLPMLASGADARVGLKLETSARFELKKTGTELVMKTTVSGDGGAPLRVRNLVPGADSSSLTLGQPLKAGVKLENEVCVKLDGDVTTALANAKSKVTISGEARAAAGFSAAGREAKVSVEVTAAQWKSAVKAVATGDAGELAPLLSAPASVEARTFKEKGGDATIGGNFGAVGAYASLEARLRDVDDEHKVKVETTLGEALAWMTN